MNCDTKNSEVLSILDVENSSITVVFVGKCYRRWT